MDLGIEIGIATLGRMTAARSLVFISFMFKGESPFLLGGESSESENLTFPFHTIVYVYLNQPGHIFTTIGTYVGPASKNSTPLWP